VARNYRNVVIRQAKPQDSHLLLKAEREITLQKPGHMIPQPHELKSEHFEQKIGELSDHSRGVYLVAQLEDQIVGHALLDPMQLEATQHVAHLTTVVHHGHQGHGVGQKLTQHLIEWSRSRSQLEKIELQVRNTNNPAISLYKKIGFQEEGRWLRRVKLGDQYLDDILMGLWL
jgi:ribosomal protein S18 acetylase RimI-like enzyme